MLEKINRSAQFILKETSSVPEVGIILGTGLGGLVREIEITHILEYQDIPNFPISTVEGHRGKLIFGNLSGKKVIAMQGRFHFYEGYNMQEVTFPVRVMKRLGIKTLIVSNASGGVNPDFEIGDLMIINDHINLIPNPLIGKNNPEFGPRFPDMSNAYDKKLIEKAEAIAKKNKIKVQKGIYTAVTGPTLETPSEYKYFRIIGSDAVGMSTVPEIIVAHQMEITCFAISIITDLGVPGKIVKVTQTDVLNVAEKSEPLMTLIIKELIAEL
ncbi:MAG: purine-nucleoside phosphorylase [Bacteroidetes bacterium CG23_combo_of_CG06-09_8_20_14_all_32_9]|nr:MAG: purine-nucleoside phosphorylase [Bacteroidetes bacterium CG23_combo_of_CG06-09_8_20_14_all_32_9]